MNQNFVDKDFYFIKFPIATCERNVIDYWRSPQGGQSIERKKSQQWKTRNAGKGGHKETESLLRDDSHRRHDVPPVAAYTQSCPPDDYSGMVGRYGAAIRILRVQRGIVAT